MTKSLKRAAASHLISYLASTQAFAMVVLHAGWVLLALATWGAAEGGAGAGSITRPLVRAFVWLGGVDEHGHGDATTIMAVWGQLSLVVYALELLVKKVRGERPPLGLARVSMISGLVALAGWLFALWPTPDGLGDAWVALLFAVLTLAATMWALAASRVAELLVARFQPEPHEQRQGGRQTALSDGA